MCKFNEIYGCTVIKKFILVSVLVVPCLVHAQFSGVLNDLKAISETLKQIPVSEHQKSKDSSTKPATGVSDVQLPKMGTYLAVSHDGKRIKSNYLIIKSIDDRSLSVYFEQSGAEMIPYSWLDIDFVKMRDSYKFSANEGSDYSPCEISIKFTDKSTIILQQQGQCGLPPRQGLFEKYSLEPGYMPIKTAKQQELENEKIAIANIKAGKTSVSSSAIDLNLMIEKDIEKFIVTCGKVKTKYPSKFSGVSFRGVEVVEYIPEFAGGEGNHWGYILNASEEKLKNIIPEAAKTKKMKMDKQTAKEHMFIERQIKEWQGGGSWLKCGGVWKGGFVD